MIEEGEIQLLTNACILGAQSIFGADLNAPHEVNIEHTTGNGSGSGSILRPWQYSEQIIGAYIRK
jgi:hypothetical protein